MADDPVDAVAAGGAVVEMPTPEFSPSMIAQINQRFALVIVGGRAMVMDERPGGPDGRGVRFLTPEAFRLTHGARPVYIGQRRRHIGDIWLESQSRRFYDGVLFLPGGPREIDGHYNLWRGFVAGDAAGDGDAAPLFEHVHNVIAAGDGQLANWIIGWFAQMIQRPAERPGTSLVLRGGQGTGKTMLGAIIGRLFPDHYLLVDDPRYITGQFNAHLTSCLLLQADEGFWAGDKQAEGHLKGLVTSEWQMIERKGVDPVRVRNCMRLMVTSNEDWVVPVGFRERRFAVIDVADSRQQDGRYFRRLWENFQKPENVAALLSELMEFRLDAVDVWRIPRTQALLDQLVDSADVLTVWWFDVLDKGEVLEEDGWPGFVPTALLYRCYFAAWEKRRIGRPLPERSFVKRLKRLCPGMRRVRRETTGEDGFKHRRWGYELPALAAARRMFEEVIGQPVDWPVEE